MVACVNFSPSPSLPSIKIQSGLIPRSDASAVTAAVIGESARGEERVGCVLLPPKIISISVLQGTERGFDGKPPNVVWEVEAEGTFESPSDSHEAGPFATLIVSDEGNRILSIAIQVVRNGRASSCPAR